jgi:uncharacterized surface protein with fasciclin (FAS1) repeats
MKKIFYYSQILVFFAALILTNACKRDKGEVLLQPRNERDIVEVLQRETKGDFTILLEALKVSGLEQTLMVEAGKNPDKRYILFAPTNKGWGPALLALGVPSIGQADPTSLRELLLGHIYEFPADAQKIDNIDKMNEGTYPTLRQGVNVDINFDCNGVPYINGRVVVAFQRVAKNGFVVAVEDVLTPPTKTLAEILNSDPNLSVFHQLLQKAGLAAQFGDVNKSFTIFAPSNIALLNATAVGYPVDLIPANFNTTAELAFLDSVMRYHIIEGRKVYQLSVCNEEPYKTQLGQDIQLDANGIICGNYADWALVTTGNAQYAKNGVIHYVDYPLLPASQNVKQKINQMPELPSNPNDSYALARQALSITGVIDDLDRLDRITVLLPTDAAFNAFLALNNFNSIYDIPLDKLTEIMKFHVITRRAFFNDFGVKMNTLQGEQIQTLTPTTANYVAAPYFYADPAGRIDVKMSNGNIQCIRKVMVPKEVKLKQVP